MATGLGARHDENVDAGFGVFDGVLAGTGQGADSDVFVLSYYGSSSVTENDKLEDKNDSVDLVYTDTHSNLMQYVFFWTGF